MFEGSLSSVLIVENECGQIYFVEDKNKKSKNDREERKTSKRKTVKVKTEIESDDDEEFELPLIKIKEEIKEEPPDVEEIIAEFEPPECYVAPSVPFIDPSMGVDEIQIKKEPKVEKDDSDDDYGNVQGTFDGNWSSDDNKSLDFDTPIVPAVSSANEYNNNTDSAGEGGKKKRIKRKMHKITDLKAKITLAKHKFRNLRGRFACRYCDTVFANKQEKSEHKCKYLECDPKNFICRFCSKELSRKTFSNHVHEALSCQYCGRKILNPRNMKLHIQKKHKNEKPKAPKVKKRKEEIEQYVKEKLNEEAEIMERLKENPIIEHKKYYPKKKISIRHECDLCGKYLMSMNSLKQHMNIHLDQPLDICAICGEKFYTKKGMHYHSCNRKQRRPDSESRITDKRHCRYCDSRFESYDENIAHKCQYKNPANKNLVICRFCGKQIQRNAFNRHIEFHSGVEWTCKICNKSVASKRQLKIHLTIHTGDKPHKCTICNEGFCNKTALNYHMRFHGENTKVYRCEFCFKELSTDYSLKSHIQRVHRKTSLCEICKLEFTNKDALKDHISLSHPPSVCKECGKTFALPRYLRMHERLHFQTAEETRYPCSICSKYLTERNLKSHVFRKHPEQFEEWSLNHAN